MLVELKTKYQEWADKKRAQLEAALERNEVADPISILISIGVSALVSSASGPLTRAKGKRECSQINK